MIFTTRVWDVGSSLHRWQTQSLGRCVTRNSESRWEDMNQSVPWQGGAGKMHPWGSQTWGKMINKHTSCFALLFLPLTVPLEKADLLASLEYSFLWLRWVLIWTLSGVVRESAHEVLVTSQRESLWQLTSRSPFLRISKSHSTSQQVRDIEI